jgi:hypothetical protein
MTNRKKEQNKETMTNRTKGKNNIKTVKGQKKRYNKHNKQTERTKENTPKKKENKLDARVYSSKKTTPLDSTI